MKKIFLAISIILIAISCKKESEKTNTNGFELTVTAKNFPDSTKVYLYDDDIEIKMDSAYVINENFKLSGNVDFPSMCYLFFYDSENKPIEDYKYLFVENKNISIVGEYSDFFNAKVIGSNQNDLFNQYQSISANSENSERPSNQLHFLFSNPNNQMSLRELLHKKKEISKDSLLLFHKKLNITNSNSPKGLELLTYINTDQVKIGDKFRDIWGNDLNGVQHKLSDYYGKIILLDFWSPDCPYSSQQHQTELPKLVQKYNQEDFMIISYFVDTEIDELAKSTENNYENWLNISDLKGMKGENISEYDVTGTPNSFLIDKNGIIVKSFIEFYKGEINIEKEIDKLLK